MKNFILSLISLFFISFASSQPAKTDLSVNNIKGKVKSIKDVKFAGIEKPAGVIINKRRNDNINSYFNTSGNLVEEIFINADGSLNYHDNFNYDSKQKKIESYTMNYQFMVTGRQEFKYDSSGKLIKIVYLNWNDSLIRTAYFNYDDKGNKIEEINIGYNGLRHFGKTFKYDEKNI